MPMTITFSWTYDECLEQANRFVLSHMPTPPTQEPPVYTSHVIANIDGKRFKMGRHVDIHIGSKDSGFVLWRRYCSVQAAAHALWLNNGANIFHYLKTGATYKGIYKFFYHENKN